MKTWPLIRHLRYAWLRARMLRAWRPGRHAPLDDMDLYHIWTGRA